ncbi:MAG: protein translocase subunit SecDF [Rikenellaceae bacterium]
MQSKGAIKVLAISLAIACIYQLSFTFKARSVEKDAVKYAAEFSQENQTKTLNREQFYLDSIQNEVVYNLGFTQFTYKQVKEKELNLGLDLKGGMNVMLEIEVQDVIKTLAGESVSNPAFIEAMAIADEQFKSGASQDYISAFVSAFESSSNGGSLAAIFVSPERKDIMPNSSNAEVERVLRNEAEAAIATSFNILRNRIDRFGVTQPNIQRLPGANRVLVELPGVKEPQRVRNLLQGAASLEFWTTYDAREVFSALAAADRIIKDMNNSEVVEAEAEVVETEEVEATEPTEATTEETDLLDEVGAATATEEVATGLSIDENPLFALLNPQYAGGAVVGAASPSDMAQIDAYLALPEVKDLFPADIRFMWGIKGMDDLEGRYFLYAIRAERADGKAPLDGSVVTDAREMYSDQGATAEVSVSMNATGLKEWARLTGENVGKCVAIVLDGYVYSAPVIQTNIERGNTLITGNFTIQEAKDLANVLKSGKVPAPARIIQEEVVGPSLGQESIDAGLMSFIIAFCLVLLYMGLFYKNAGWLSDIALIFNVFLLLGVLVSFGAVLTLPGIAGIVLTMGMAVDANVIIYERIKEELRSGKGLGASIKDGFANAYSAIIDGNVTTLITGIVLAIFGTGPVQGFATTLVIGIMTSFFCSVFITRLLLEWANEKFGGVKFSRKWSENWLKNLSINFIDKRKSAYILSSCIIVLGIASLAIRGLNMGTEFTGGRAYVVRFDRAVSAEEVREAIDKQFTGIADASAVSFEVKQYGDENQMRIVTQYLYDDTREEATEIIYQNLYDAVSPLYSYDISYDQFCNNQDDENGIISTNKIGPSIAKDMTWGAIWSILLSLCAIGLYITARFKGWQWASGATAALIHDTFIVIALFSILYGWMPFNLEINQAFIAAILTIIGYSINDTVIIFDRIREYIGLYPKRQLKENINGAINSTMARTLNTSGTTFITLLSIFIFGGETIRGFVFALIVGIIVGTYSSLFIATPVAYDMMAKNETKKK